MLTWLVDSHATPSICLEKFFDHCERVYWSFILIDLEVGIMLERGQELETAYTKMLWSSVIKKWSHGLPPWPAEVPGECVGMEERVGACCWPQHYEFSVLTGNQTRRDKDTRSRINLKFHTNLRSHSKILCMCQQSTDICFQTMSNNSTFYFT